MAPKRKQFKKPPLVEVFCEFFFQIQDGVEWDSFLVPTFYKKIKANYPTRKRIASVGIAVRVQGGSSAPEIQPPVGPPTPRHRFIAADGKTLIQLGENLLVVNQLPPYYGWEKFEPKIIEAFELYMQLWKPKAVARAAVHYINKVDIPEAEVNLEDYFHLLPGIPDFPRSPVTNVTLAYEVKGAMEGDIVAVTMRQPPSASPDGVSFLFQWDYVATQGISFAKTDVQGWLKGAHDYQSKMFLSTFTEKCLQMFDREGD